MQILGLINSKKLHSEALNLLHSEVLNEKNVPRGVFSCIIQKKAVPLQANYHQYYEKNHSFLFVERHHEREHVCANALCRR
jgi:hypothetical protein